jgi:RND family efflux transporter MFP subunit
MTKANILRRATLGVALAVATACVGYLTNTVARTASAATSPAVSEGSQFRGVTKPSEESNLAFSGPGIVDQVVVKPGKVVKAGDILATEDGKEEVAKLNIAKLLAESTKEIEAAQADLASKKVDLKRKEDLYSEKIARGETTSELDEAKVAVQIAEIVVKFREESKVKAGLDLAQQQVMVDKKKLVSPIDGIVAKVDIHPGDGADLTKPAVQIVQIDQLWVEADIPSTRTRQLKVNQELMVRYTDEDAWQKATIIFLTPYANAGSNTRHIRLTMSNPIGREAGLPVMVQLPDNETAAAK